MKIEIIDSMMQLCFLMLESMAIKSTITLNNVLVDYKSRILNVANS